VVARGVQPLGGDGEPLSGLLLASSLVLLRVGKNQGFKKKPAQWGFLGFFLFFFGFFWVFWVFWVSKNIFAQKREFLGFFQFQEYF
jgi:hypothetical protein